MKINSTPSGNANFINGSYRAAKVSAYKTEQRMPGSDEALLSNEAVSFSRIFAEAREAADVRSPEELFRVADIKQQVQSGTYNVDSGEVADSILGSIFA